MAELRFMCSHIDRKSNEIIFSKCLNPNCSHCVEKPVISTKAWSYLKDRGFKWPNPKESGNYPGHFKTFLEMDKIETDFFDTGN